MSAEPIDIEVRDKIAAGIRDKLLNLAQAALEGANNVDKLNAQLAKLDGSQISRLAGAQATLEKQTLKNNLAYLAEEAALNKAIAAETKAASSAQQLATAQAKAQTASAVGAAQAATANERLAAAAAQAETAQIRAAAASAKSAQAAQAASSAVNAFGETEAQVAARLSGVASAGANLAKQQQAIGITATEAAGAEKQLTAATAQAGAAASTAASRYSNYMSALNTVKKAGPIPNTLPDPKKIDDVTSATTKLGHANAGVTRELIVLGHEAVSGNFSRIPGSLLVLAERTNGFGGAIQLLASVFTPLNVAIGVTVGLFVVYLKSLDDIENSQARLNNVMKLTGGIAAFTVDSYEALAKSIATANNITISSAKDLVGELAASGRFQADQIAVIADNAVKLGKLSNTAADEIIKSFIKAQDAPAAYAKTLEETSAAITPLQLDEIKRLDDMGQHAQAARLLQKDLYDFLKNNTPEALHGLSGLWQTLKNDINGATVAVEDFIRASDKQTATNADQAGDLQTSINAYTKLKDVLTSLGATGLAKIVSDRLAFKQGSLDGLKDSVAIIQEQQQATSDAAAASKVAAEAQTALGDSLKFSKGNVALMNDELKKFRTNLDLALNNPATKNSKTTLDALDNQAAIEAAIRRKYAAPKTAATPEESRAVIIAKSTAELQKQLLAYGDIKDVRDEILKIDQLDIQLATHTKDGRLAPLKALTDAEKAKLTLDLQQIESNKRVEASQDAIYQNIAGPQQRLQDGQVAINNLLNKGRITANEAAEAQRALNFAYDSAKNPLLQFDKELKQQNDLLESNLTAKERAAKTAVNQINNQLAPQGKKLTDDQAQHVEQAVLAQQKLNEVTAAYDAIVAANQGAVDKLTTQQEALNKAQSAGIISAEQYAVATTQLAIAKAQLRLDNGVGSQVDIGLASIGKLLDGYKNVLSGLTSAFGDFFKSINDGFADSVAHALVFGGSLRDSLLNVAQQAVEQLLSSLIKLGIQWVIQQALGTEATTTQVAGIAAQTTAYAAGKASQAAAAVASMEVVTAASVASGLLVAEAWAAAAALVSLASFGANAIPAAEGVSATVLLSQALAAFQTGGYTGDGGVGEVAGLVHGKEFVVNAAGTAANRGTLEAMNRGDSVGGSGVKVSINNYGSSKIEVEHISRDEIRIIAKDESRAAVQRYGPDATAGALTNPNSKVSKAINNGWQVQPNKV